MSSRTKVGRIRGFVSRLGVSYFDRGLTGTDAGASVLTPGRHLGSAKTTQAIRITTGEHREGSFPPTPAGRGRGGGRY